MNTVKSFWIGWGSLVVGGAGAYFFAKREIDADRRQKHAERQRKQYEQNMLRYGGEIGDDGKPYQSPSTEANTDPAPTRHEPTNAEQAVREKSKYEATQVYRSKKGDRFS